MPARLRPAEFDNDLYGVLGVERTAQIDQIKDAFKQLVRQPDSELLSRYPSFHPQHPTHSSSPSDYPQSIPSARSSGIVDSPGQALRYHPDRHRHDSENMQEANRRFQDIDEAYKVLSDPDSRSWYDKSTESKKPKRAAHKPPPSSSSTSPTRLSRKKPAPPMPSAESIHSPYAHRPVVDMTAHTKGAVAGPHDPAAPFKRAQPTKSALKNRNASDLASPISETMLTPSSTGNSLLSTRPPTGRQPASRTIPGLAHVPRISTASATMLPSIPESPSPEEQPFTFSPPTTSASFTTSQRSSSLLSPQFSGRGTSRASSVAFSSSSLSNFSPHDIQHPLPDRASPGRGPLRALNPDPESSDQAESPARPNVRLPQHSSQSRRRVTRSESHLAPPVSNSQPHHSRSQSESDTHPARLSSNGDSPKTKRTVSIKDEASYFDGSSAPPRSNGYPRSNTDAQSSAPSSGHGRQGGRKSKSNAHPERVPAEWIYPLPLSLEELHNGDQQQYKITQHLLDGTTKDQYVDINIQPGWKNGTKIIFPKMGNQRPDGSFQDVVFIVEQLHHERFARLDGGRLVVNMEIDFFEALKDGFNDKRHNMKIRGLDGNPVDITVSHGIIRNGMETIVRGAGMPMRSKSRVVGKGDLIVRWSIRFPKHLTPDQLGAMRSVLEM